jgi:chromosome segregation ATPase
MSFVNVASGQQPPVQDPGDGGVWTDQVDSGALLKAWEENPILRSENADLREQVQNLKEQLKVKDALLEISEQRRQLQVERADFYMKVVESQEKLTKQYAEANEKLQKQVERKAIWERVWFAVGAVVGGAIAALF